MRLRAVVALGSMYVLSSCREPVGNGEAGTEGSGDEGAVVDARHTEAGGTPEFYAADAAYLQKNSTFFFKVWGDAFTKDLDDLPMQGEVPDDKKPHSGGYYAEGDGGTNQVVAGNKTPLQKYDSAFNGGQNKAAAWEQEKHTTGPVWAGHCNGFAATTQRHPKEPFKPVTRNGVTFEPQDVKALLAEIHMNADYEFLGGNRCDIEGTPPAPTDRTDPTVMAVCEDINPGTLHAAIANWIGRTKHTLIMDMFAGDQVWNYPLYKYEVTRKDGITEAQAKQYVTGAAGADYQFNPAATKFAYVETTMTFAEAFKREALKTLTPGSMSLKYVLEMDAAGAILGGEWVGADSRKNHPDFLWVALEPLEPNGTRYMGNQYLSNQEVIKLWAESVGEDPENPPLDIKRPSGPDDWGKWPDFEITLDGNQRGAVFGGKPATLRIKRKEQLLGDVALEVLLNGATLKKVNATAEEEITFAFTPGIGLSRLQFNWSRGGTALDPEYARFHAVR
jgi:hypothetical protein